MKKGKSFGGKAYEIALVRHDRRKRKVNSNVQVYEGNLIPLYGYKLRRQPHGLVGPLAWTATVKEAIPN